MLKAKHASILIAMALMLASTAALHAQAFGRVVLVIVDEAGEPIQGVQVTVTSKEITNFKEVRKTNKKGKVSFGITDATRTYDFLVEKEGYPPMERPVKPKVKDTTNMQITFAKTVAGQQDGNSAPADAPKIFTPAERTFNEGVELLQASDFDGAKGKFVEALEKNPNMSLAHSALAGVYLQEENYEQALASVDQFLVAEPESSRGIRFRYEALKGLGRAEEADEMLKKLKKLDKGGDTAKMIFNEGVAASKVGDFTNAKARFREALDLDPTIIQAVGALAIIHFNEGEFAEAATMAEKQLVSQPNNLKAMRIRYDSYRALGDKEKTEEAMKVLAGNDPSVLVAEFFNRGVTLFEGGDVAGAVDAFSQVLDLDANHADSHYRLGICHVGTGDTAAAKTHLEKFLELAPNHAEAGVAKDMLSYLN